MHRGVSVNTSSQKVLFRASLVVQVHSGRSADVGSIPADGSTLGATPQARRSLGKTLHGSSEISTLGLEPLTSCKTAVAEGKLYLSATKLQAICVKLSNMKI